eukprot:Awhi_evm1s8559
MLTNINYSLYIITAHPRTPRLSSSNVDEFLIPTAATQEMNDDGYAMMDLDNNTSIGNESADNISLGTESHELEFDFDNPNQVNVAPDFDLGLAQYEVDFPMMHT